jgi:hypothetical protein
MRTASGKITYRRQHSRRVEVSEIGSGPPKVLAAGSTLASTAALFAYGTRPVTAAIVGGLVMINFAAADKWRIVRRPVRTEQPPPPDAETLHKLTTANGGATYLHDRGYVTEPTDRPLYVVGGAGNVRVVPTSTFRATDVPINRDADGIGTWIDGDKTYTENVTAHRNRSAAIKVARERGEKAIFDLHTMSEIRTEPVPAFKVNSTYSLDSQAPVDAKLDKHGLTMDKLTAEIVSGARPRLAEGKTWYPRASRWARKVARQTGHTEDQTIAVISAVSPRCPWKRNKQMAEAILKHHRQTGHLSADDAAERFGLGMNANVATAIRVARGEPIEKTLTGPKRQSFFNNLSRPGRTDDVTVDGWMAQALTRASGGAVSSQQAQKVISSHGRNTPHDMAGYTAVAEATRRAARILRAPVDAVQAAYWIAVRGDSE